jgi:hypothetical protein
MTRIPASGRLTASALALFALFTPPGLDAQTQTIDRGVLLVLRDGEVVGREEFAVRRGTTSATTAGFTVASTALYPADRPDRSLVSVVELGADSFPNAVRFEVGNGDILRVAVGVGPRRITVRRGTATSESAREYPARERPIVLDDSVFAPLAVRPPAGRTGRRLSLHGALGDPLEIVDRGIESTLVDAASVSLQRLSLRFAGESVEAWYDDSGKLMKVDWPNRRIQVIRAPEP